MEECSSCAVKEGDGRKGLRECRRQWWIKNVWNEFVKRAFFYKALIPLVLERTKPLCIIQRSILVIFISSSLSFSKYEL